MSYTDALPTITPNQMLALKAEHPGLHINWHMHTGLTIRTHNLGSELGSFRYDNIKKVIDFCKANDIDFYDNNM